MLKIKLRKKSQLKKEKKTRYNSQNHDMSH